MSTSNQQDLLTLDYTELENELPAILVNQEITFPVTNNSFVDAVIRALSDSGTPNNLNIEVPPSYRLKYTSGNGISFKPIDNEKEVVQLYFKKLLVGHTIISDLLPIFILIRDQLSNLKQQSLDNQ